MFMSENAEALMVVTFDKRRDVVFLLQEGTWGVEKGALCAFFCRRQSMKEIGDFNMRSWKPVGKQHETVICRMTLEIKNRE